MNNHWSKYRPLTKLDQLAETIMKTAFIMSENHHVIQSYVEHKGANFRVVNRVPTSAKATAGRGEEREFDVLCRQINIEKTNYTFISKNDLEQGIRADLYIGLVVFIDNEPPRKYLIPSTVWSDPNRLFTDSVRPEYGINLHSSTFQVVTKYAFEEQIKQV